MGRFLPAAWSKVRRKFGAHRFCPTTESVESRCLLAVFTVNSTADTVDMNPNVTTLREALLDAAANGDDERDLIIFDTGVDPLIGLEPPFVIQPETPLPVVPDNVAIDGFRDENGNDVRNQAVVEIDGIFIFDDGVDGLRLRRDSEVRGLSIHGFTGSNISLDSRNISEPPSQTRTFPSTNIGQMIPPSGTGGPGSAPTVSTLTVADVGTILDISVSIRIDHTFVGDLVLTLVAPDGTRILLANRRGGGGDNFGSGTVFTTFDDEASLSVESGLAPFAGSFRPESSLSVLLGKVMTGDYRLEVQDQAALDSGRLLGFSLNIRFAQTPPAPALMRPSADIGQMIPLSGTGGPGSAPTVSRLTVSDPGLVSDINVNVRLDHTFVGDLVLTLVAPDGTRILLANRQGGGGDNFGSGTGTGAVFTTFDDDGFLSITEGSAPFTGSFRPESPLSVLRGKPIAGDYRLEIQDQAALDTGRLLGFSLSFSDAPNVEPSLNNRVIRNRIGVDANGDVDFDFSSPVGVRVANSMSNTIEDNLISGNGGGGLLFSMASSNVVRRNIIGLDPSGTRALLNVQDFGNGIPGDRALAINASGFGILLQASDNNTFRGNTVSGNFGDGFRVSLSSKNNQLYGNMIGTDRFGSAELGLGNTGDGLRLEDGAQGNTAGGSSAADANVISGNDGYGVRIAASSRAPIPGLDSFQTENNQIRGNIIGTDKAGGQSLGNGLGGVLVDSVNNTVGGSVSGQGNLISGNLGHGVALESPRNRLFSSTLIPLDEEENEQSISLQSKSGLILDADVTLTLDVNSGAALAELQVELMFMPTSGGSSVTIVLLPFGAAGFPRDIGLLRLTFDDDARRPIADATSSGAFRPSQPLSALAGLDGSGSFTLIVSRANDQDSSVLATLAAFELNLQQRLTSASNNVVQGNRVGLSADGTRGIGNAGDGIRVADVEGTTIGGSASFAGNVISANSSHGVHVLNRLAATGVDFTSPVRTLVQGNRIGTRSDGSVDPSRALGNNGDGVLIEGDHRVQVGGSIPYSTSGGQGNLIAGNSAGVRVISPAILGIPMTPRSQFNEIGGNRIAANNQNGISIEDASNTRIFNNTIFANRGNGVNLEPVAQSTTLLGNRIGLNESGAEAGNQVHGVFVNGAAGSVIGGTASGDRNFISANLSDGIRIEGAMSSGTRIVNNIIGLSEDGTRDAGNGIDGIAILGASAITVGGAGANERNIISGNNSNGVRIVAQLRQGAPANDGDDNRIQNNIIGLSLAGDRDLGNGLDGVAIDGSSRNMVLGNIISGNNASGVRIFTDVNRLGDANPPPIAEANVILGNRIGVGADGLADLGNSGHGILVSDSSRNTIGGTTDADRNIISRNDQSGVAIQRTREPSGDPAIDLMLERLGEANRVLGNYIGLAQDGLTRAGNSAQGVVISNARRNVIGGTDPRARNVISANQFTGIEIVGQRAVGNQVLGNFIGTDALGSQDRGNAASGVLVRDNAAGNVIGGSLDDNSAVNAIAGNVISGNDGFGIHLFEIAAGPNLNLILGNTIGIGRNNGNTLDGVYLDRAFAVQIGGPAPDQGNRIAGNGQSGVHVNHNGADPAFAGAPSLIQGNSIADNRNFGVFLDAAANVRLANNTIAGNMNSGVLALQSFNNRIEFNTIANNGNDGVEVNDERSAGNQIVGNTIDGNRRDGVAILGGRDTVINGGNAIVRNQRHGVNVFGATATGNRIAGNFIGTNSVGASGLGNRFAGVALQNTAGNIIGAEDADATPTGALPSNVIAGNGASGVLIAGPSSDLNPDQTNLVRGNFIGLTRQGAPLGNARGGVEIELARGNRVERNVIASSSANETFGVQITGRSSVNNSIHRNIIGTNANGGDGFGFAIGVTIDSAHDVQVTGNRIAGNDRAGVFITNSFALVVNETGQQILSSILDSDRQTVLARVFDAGNLLKTDLTNLDGADTVNNVIAGNEIGFVAGRVIETAQGDAPIQDFGIVIVNADNNLIVANTIAGNRQAGIQITGRGARGNQIIVGNKIGLITDNGVRVGNRDSGIHIDTAPQTLIEGNTIVSNGRVFGARTGRTHFSGGAPGIHLVGLFAQPASAAFTTQGAFDPGITVRNNVIQSNEVGILVNGSSNNLIDGNTIRDGREAGLILFGGAQNQGRQTAAQANPRRRGPVKTFNAIRNVVVNNVITNNGRPQPNGELGYGILFYNASSQANSVAPNQAFGNGVDNREYNGQVLMRDANGLSPLAPRLRRRR